jgi:hypothetical protein
MSSADSVKKLAIVGLVVGLLVLVLRVVRGGDDGEGIIDRIDTGNERNDQPVATGLDRVDTADDEEDGVEDDPTEPASHTDDENDAVDEDDGTVALPEGRFDDLDLLDYVAILGAAYRAAREEYDQRV